MKFQGIINKDKKEKTKEQAAKEKKDSTSETREIRKSSRLQTKNDDVKPKPVQAPKKPESKSEGQPKDQNATKAPTRAPVGSLTNNPEWNGVISELEHASAHQVMSHEQFMEWQTLLRKDTLTPLEKMQEAAFTELINTRSLEQHKIEEDERMKEMLGRRELFKPDEKVFKYKQSIKNKNFLSEYVFPSVSHYPKSFNTKDTRSQDQDPNLNKEGSFIKPWS